MILIGHFYAVGSPGGRSAVTPSGIVVTSSHHLFLGAKG